MSNRQGLCVLMCCFVLLISGCSNTRLTGAPVVDRSHAHAVSDKYRVEQDDTLYSIAWMYQLDYRALVAMNGLRPPYTIHVGQWLRVKPTKKRRGQIASRSLSSVAPEVHSMASSSPLKTQWRWPTAGRLIRSFSKKPFAEKGISLAGRLGAPVVAAMNGVVVYSGAGVRGYGNLIIIKHDQNYLSAYAFNQRNLVKDGDKVSAGQKIAEMGRDNSGRVLLYFEIRRNGRPVNPALYLHRH